MPADLLNLILLLAGVALAFFVSRALAARWRSRREKRDADAPGAGESRQVRRARERRGK